jgi:hypothetical protein
MLVLIFLRRPGISPPGVLPAPAQAWSRVEAASRNSCLFCSGVSCDEGWIPFPFPVESALVFVRRSWVFRRVTQTYPVE